MQRAQEVMLLEPSLIQMFFFSLFIFVIGNHILKGCNGKNQGLKHIVEEVVWHITLQKCWIENISMLISANFSLGGTIRNHLTKIIRKLDPI
jgi:hypothetical protein